MKLQIDYKVLRLLSAFFIAILAFLSQVELRLLGWNLSMFIAIGIAFFGALVLEYTMRKFLNLGSNLNSTIKDLFALLGVVFFGELVGAVSQILYTHEVSAESIELYFWMNLPVFLFIAVPILLAFGGGAIVGKSLRKVVDSKATRTVR